MTKECLDNNIIVIQCDFANLTLALTKALTIGSNKTICLNRKNVTTSYLLNLLRCYTPFVSEVTYAYKIVFTLNTPGIVDADLILFNNLYNLNQTMSTSEELAIYYAQKIKTQVGSVDYKTEIVGNILYLYSYDIAADFADTTSLSVNSGDISSNITTLQNNLDEILNLWNSLTEDEICKILTFATNESKYSAITVNTNTCNC